MVLTLRDPNIDFASVDFGSFDFVNIATAIASTLHERIWQNELPPPRASSRDGICKIALGFYDPQVTIDSLVAGILMAKAAFLAASGLTDSGDASAARIRSPPIRRLLTNSYDPPVSKTTATLVRLARARVMPVHPVSERVGIYMFGQGAKGIHFQALANQHGSLTAQGLYQRKDIASELHPRIGILAAAHQITPSAEAAREIARGLDFPLVVKSCDRDFGFGTNMGINSFEELGRAFVKVRAAAPNHPILVERVVAGDHHRLTIFNGKLIAASRHLPATIIGDGERSVEELIGAQNAKQPNEPALGVRLASLVIDDEMEGLLKKQGYALGNIPQQGVRLRLRETSNLYTDGAREDVLEAVHPDNALMAVAIARSFHSDAMGIDFITPDIGKAWHEIPCAVVDVNGSPGMSTEKILENILLEKFPEGENAQIPSILILEGSAEIVDSIANQVRNCAH